MSTQGCDAHGDIPTELRALAELLAEALEPWAQRLRDAADEREGQPGTAVPRTCTWCPVCAVVGLLRDQRPELAARLAEHGVGLLTALRELLAEHTASAGDRDAATGANGSGGGGRSGAQHVPVRRAGGAGERTDGGEDGGGAGC
ncbi:MAG: hypothetical protein GEU83_16765 [Pseudonocardiaceae bacterium]|nr:hypothetical protein [Pseudonocardiaceae bacterium]